jgi:hypothetical protein
MLGVNIAGVYLAEIDAPDVGWERESVPEVLASLIDEPPLVRDERLVRSAADPVVPFAIKFSLGRWPGQDVGDDAEWAATAALARRRLTVWQDTGIGGTSTGRGCFEVRRARSGYVVGRSCNGKGATSAPLRFKSPTWTKLARPNWLQL